MPWLATVVAQQDLVEAIGLQVLKHRMGFFLGAMAAVGKQHHIGLGGLAEVLAKAGDDVVAGGLLVGELLQYQALALPLQRGTVGGIYPVSEVGFQSIDVVNAALKGINSWRIVIDTHKQGIDALSCLGSWVGVGGGCHDGRLRRRGIGLTSCLVNQSLLSSLQFRKLMGVIPYSSSP